MLCSMHDEKKPTVQVSTSGVYHPAGDSWRLTHVRSLRVPQCDSKHKGGADEVLKK